MRRRRLLLGCLVLAPLLLPAQEPLDIGQRRQVFIDGRFLANSDGVEFRVHPPRKTGEIVIGSESPWQLGGYNTVLKDGDRYRLWYMAGGTIAYAESNDGIHFRKPSLTLSTAHGTKRNNVVIGYGAGEVKEGVHGLMVFVDPKAPERERFRLVANPPEFNSMLQVFSSPDGIHWKHTYPDVMTFRADRKPHHLDSQNVIFWDDRIGKYVAYVRKNLREKGAQGRSVARAESADLAHFPPVEQLPVVFRADGWTPGHYDPLRKQQVAVMDVYTNGTFKYSWAQDAYYMFPTLYYHYGGFLHEFEKQAPVNAGIMDTRFAAGRDGIHWRTFGEEPFLRLGMEGEFDCRRIYIAYGVVPALNGRDMYMYYAGTNETHGWDRDDRNNRLLMAAGVAPEPAERRAISRVVLRRDGFISLRAGPDGGDFTTPPLRFEGDQLALNVDTSATGEVQIEIQDAGGTPIPGFTQADCDIVHSTNEVSRVVTWKGASDIGKLAGKAVRLRFAMRDVDLYAFQFQYRSNL